MLANLFRRLVRAPILRRFLWRRGYDYLARRHAVRRWAFLKYGDHVPTDGPVALAPAAGITVLVDVLRGDNDHPRAGAAFTAVALALRTAVGASGFDDVPSTKGTIGGVAP